MKIVSVFDISRICQCTYVPLKELFASLFLFPMLFLCHFFSYNNDITYGNPNVIKTATVLSKLWLAKQESHEA